VKLTRKGQWILLGLVILVGALMISPAIAGWVLAAEILAAVLIWIGLLTLAPWLLALRLFAGRK